MLSEVLDRPLRVLRRQVLEHLDAGDQVVRGVELVRHRAHKAEGLELNGNLGDRVVGHVESPRLDAALTKCLDQEADRTTGVEHGLRGKLRDDEVRNAIEKPLPVRIAAVVRRPEPRLEVVRVVLAGAGPTRVARCLTRTCLRHHRDATRISSGRCDGQLHLLEDVPRP